MYILANKVIELNNPDYFYRRDISKGISSINYQQNENIMEIFKVTDTLIQDVISVGKYEEYKETLNLICISYILKRVEELENWSCGSEEKQIIKEKIFKNIYERYGKLNYYDQSQLYSKVPFEIVEEYTAYCNNLAQTKVIY